MKIVNAHCLHGNMISMLFRWVSRGNKKKMLRFPFPKIFCFLLLSHIFFFLQWICFSVFILFFYSVISVYTGNFLFTNTFINIFIDTAHLADSIGQQLQSYFCWQFFFFFFCCCCLFYSLVISVSHSHCLSLLFWILKM